VVGLWLDACYQPSKKLQDISENLKYRKLEINYCILEIKSYTFRDEFLRTNFKQMKQLNMHILNNPLASGARGSLGLPCFPCAGEFVSVVSGIKINEQDSNYYGLN
jgi:hypothetical protein